MGAGEAAPRDGALSGETVPVRDSVTAQWGQSRRNTECVERSAQGPIAIALLAADASLPGTNLVVGGFGPLSSCHFRRAPANLSSKANELSPEAASV